MREIKIFITDAEFKALSYVAISPQEWAENAVKERCRIAIDEIFQEEIAKMIQDPSITEIPADKETVVMNAVIKTAEERQQEHLQKLQQIQDF